MSKVKPTKRFSCKHGHISEVDDDYARGVVTFSPDLIAYCANCEHRIHPADNVGEIICISDKRVGE